MQLDIDALKLWFTQSAVDFGLRLLAALAIFLIGRIVIRFVTRSLRRVMAARQVDPALCSFAASLIHAVLLVVVVLAALGQLGIQTTSFVAILGAAGLAVGLALQGSLSNFAAGVLIILFRPFKLGDFVEAGGTAGVVREISILTTILHTPDNKRIIVPNSGVMGGNITNFSANDTRRCDMVFGVGYGDDIRKVRRVLEELVAADPRCLKEPEPTVAVLALADSSVNFAVRPWVKTSDFWPVFFDMQREVKLRFDAEGITIPFPQRDVHLHATAGAPPAP